MGGGSGARLHPEARGVADLDREVTDVLEASLRVDAVHSEGRLEGVRASHERATGQRQVGHAFQRVADGVDPGAAGPRGIDRASRPDLYVDLVPSLAAVRLGAAVLPHADDLV